MLLAGDIGGTKVRLALYEQGARTSVKERSYLSKDYPDLSTLIQEFLKEKGAASITSLCVGVAGVVVNERCRETNFPWIIDAHLLKEQLKLDKVWVINDLEAHAWGLKMLKSEELVSLQTGKKMQGNQALVSAGTGLGEVGLFWDGRQHTPFACEGGHADYAPTNETECALWHFLKKEFDHVSYERILSGSGIYALYRFLVLTGRAEKDPDIERLCPSDEPQKQITEKALRKSSKTCIDVLNLFVSIYGAECGNTALKFLSVGGFFIGGGIAPHIVPFFQDKQFLKAFRDKGRFSELLDKIPVFLVLNEKTALLGALRYAQERE